MSGWLLYCPICDFETGPHATVEAAEKTLPRTPSGD
jgi:hypothetical protein